MGQKEEFEKIMSEIEHKLKNNPKLKEEIQNSVANIEKILGYEVDVSVIYNRGVSDYEQELEGYNLDIDDDVDEEIKLKDFIKFIEDEDSDYKVMIDPLYMKKGVNKITNVLVTTVDDYVIIVPKTSEENE
jgi:hypothetical protein